MIVSAKDFTGFIIKLDTRIHESYCWFYILHSEFYKDLVDIVALINSHKSISRPDHMNP